MTSTLLFLPSAHASTGTGGSYVPVAPARVADTESGTGFSNSSPFDADQTRLVKVTGVGGIPTSNVGAVVVDVAAASTADTRIYTYAGDETRGLSMMSVKGGAGWTSTTYIVRPDSNGKIKVYNEAGSTKLNIDVQGYFTASGTEASTGGYVPLTPTRIVDTPANKGISSSITSGPTYTVDPSSAGVPADATGIYAAIRVQDSSNTGGIRAVASDYTLTNDTPSVLTFAPNTTIDTGAAIDLGADGKFKVAVSSNVSSLKLYVDVLGYFTPGTNGGSFHPVSNRRVWDSNQSAGGSLKPYEERTIRITGNAGIPSDAPSVGAAALGLIVRDWTQAGAISVVNSDLEDGNGTSNIRWTDSYSGVAKQTTAFVETSLDGTITIRNTSSGTVSLFINNQGWFDRSYAVEDVLDPAALDETNAVAEDYARFNVPEQTITASDTSRERTFQYTLDNGEVLRNDSTNKVVTVTDAGDEWIGDLDWVGMAEDANGRVVPTSVTTSGSSLTATVNPAADTAYPITVKPKLSLPFDDSSDPETEPSGEYHIMSGPGANAGTRYKVVNRSKTKWVVNKKQVLASCSTSTDDVTCTISRTGSSTRTIGVALGVSKGFVSGELNISSASTQAVQVSCASKLKANQRLVANPVGSKHKYKIQKTFTEDGKRKTVKSGWRYTFNPYKDGFDCRVVAK